jgi:transposase
MTQAALLIEGYACVCVIADTAYDADPLRQTIAQAEAQAVIPPRANRKQPQDHDRHLYRERHLVECFFNKIKHYRRIFSRFEKLDSRFLSFLSFAGALIWLR